VRTDKRIRGEGGFTLIEVLAAMVIVAVGLLGLQALGIGAARSVVRADHQSELAAVATAAIEARQQAVRQNPAGIASGESCDTDAATGIDLCVQVEKRTTDPSLAAGSARVTVRAVHPRLVQDTFNISSYVYDPALP
jgi:prepilin-type N-terminal cleavage/methylation domain-containing protein